MIAGGIWKYLLVSIMAHTEEDFFNYLFWIILCILKNNNKSTYTLYITFPIVNILHIHSLFVKTKKLTLLQYY